MLKKTAPIGEELIEIIPNTIDNPSNAFAIDKDSNIIALPIKNGVVNILPQLVTSISISGASAITSNNKTEAYSATIQPDYATNKAVTWSVDNPSVASIDTNGILTPVTNGTVNVIATATDGSGVTGQKTVIITGQKADLFNLPLSGATISPSFSSTTYTYSATVLSNVTSVVITPQTQDGSTYEIKNNGTLISGTTVNLSQGLNSITIKVSKPNTLDSTYTIINKRAACNSISYREAAQ
jgi:hypothetical protein